MLYVLEDESWERKGKIDDAGVRDSIEKLNISHTQHEHERNTYHNSQY